MFTTVTDTLKPRYQNSTEALKEKKTEKPKHSTGRNFNPDHKKVNTYANTTTYSIIYRHFS